MTRKIPLKNYIILLVVVVLFVVLVFYLRNWYNTTSVYYDVPSPILDVSSEINQNELENYILENPNFILFTSSFKNEKIIDFEKEFKNYLINNNLTNIVYLNSADIKYFENFLEDYTIKTEKNNIKNDKGINIYIFNNSKIIEIINNASSKKIEDIDKIMKENGMIEND